MYPDWFDQAHYEAMPDEWQDIAEARLSFWRVDALGLHWPDVRDRVAELEDNGWGNQDAIRWAIMEAYYAET